ncbi:MAG: ankyrin repeat domain-containing protein [Synergistaceae bacterium]|nr:ankyrin repeat domain-containing protein [Synergistaceae bacterium]
MSEYDPLLTMSALNMAIVSLHRITSSGDRLMLDREYNSIINNLRMGEINADPALIELYQEIVRVIHKGRLRDDIRTAISKSASERKCKSIREIITGNFLKSFSFNKLRWLGKLAVSSASEYFTQQKEIQQNNDTVLRLKHDELDEYDELQRKLLGSSWSLLRNYHLPDNYRLTQKALDKFSSAINEPAPSKRNRMLKYLEGDFSMYAPYWFYRAKSSYEAGNDEAGKYFERFGEVWRPVLKRDPYKTEAMKYKIEVLMSSESSQGNAEEVLKCLEEMRANTELEDWANNIFAGMVYFSLGRKDEAEECVMCNIDFEFELEMSGRVLALFEGKSLPEELPDSPKPEPKPIVHETHPAFRTPAINSESSAKSNDAFLELCKSGNSVKIEEAINNGANVDARTDDGKTALIWAAWNGYSESAEILLRHGADVNARDNQGRTALIWAAWNGHSKAAEVLLRYRANINVQDNSGRTALMNATQRGQTEAVKVLLEYGAYVDAKDYRGWTALQIAKDNHHTEIERLLRTHGAKEVKEGLLDFLFG